MPLNWLVIVILSSVALPEKYHCQSSSSQKKYGSTTVAAGGSAANYRPSWSNGAPLAVPLRNFQAPPPLPFHYYSRLLADPYYGTAADYYYAPADSYSYPSSYDSDYYPNILYYLPPNQGSYNQGSYNQRLPPAIPYDSDEDVYVEDRENGPKNWWHDASESDLSDEDYYQINSYDDEPMTADGYDETSRTTTTTVRPRASNNPYDHRRFEGIDGFGRPREKERVFGMRRANGNDRRKHERARIYGVPVRTKYNQDEDVKELESLRDSERQQTHHFLQQQQQQQLAPKSEPLKSSIPSSARSAGQQVAGPSVSYLGPELADWINGNIKKKKSSVDSLISSTEKSPSSFKAVFENAAIEPEDSNYFRMFPDSDERDTGSDLRYSSDRSSSVFDTIKKLLAMEDKVNQQQLEEQAQIKFENQNDISTNEIAGSTRGENTKKADNRKRSLQLTDELQQTVNEYDSKTDSSLNNESLPKELENLRTNNSSDNH